MKANKVLALLLLLAVSTLVIAGTKVSRLVRTQTFASNDLFIVVTGTTTKVTRHIQGHDLARGLGPWITNSGAGGAATNAISTVKTNGTAISAAATSLDFIEGTNVVFRATNEAGLVTVQINATGGSGEVTAAQLNTASNFVYYSAVLTNQINEGNVLYVRTNGNDSTAIRGRLDKPFLTVTGVNAAAVAGDLVLFGKGVFDVGSNVVNFRHGVTFKGEGMNSTVINGTNGTFATHGPQFRPGSGVIRDLTFRTRDNNNTKYGFGYGFTNPQLCTNALVENVWFEGDTDCIYMTRPDDGIPTSIAFRNCKFTSGYDVLLLGGSTNSVFEFFNCDFIVTVSGQTNTVNINQTARWLVTQNNDGQGATITFKNCTYSSFHAAGVWQWYDGDFGDGPYNSITWENCSSTHVLTNGGVWNGWWSQMQNTNSFLKFVGHNPVEYTTSAAIYTNTPGPQRVTMTSAGASTNWLPHIHFVNNWTNAEGFTITIADGANNTARIVRALGNATITGINGSHTSYTNTRVYWRATFTPVGTNWIVTEESLPVTIPDLSVRTAFESVNTATFQSLIQLYGPINDAYLTGPAVTGINATGDRTNITIGSGLSLAGTTLTATGTGTPGGNSGSIQFNEGGAFAGTNRWTYDRTNDQVRLSVANFADGIIVTNTVNNSSVRVNEQGIFRNGVNQLLLGVNNNSNWLINSSGHWIPTSDYDVGASANPARTNYTKNLTLVNFPTNAIPYIGGGGLVSTAALSGLTLSAGTLTATGGGPSTSNNIPFTTYTAITGSPTTNILIDASLGTLFRVLLTNNMGLMITNGSDGQDLSIELYQDGTGNRTVKEVANTGGAQTNNWHFGEDITSPITLTTNQYKKDLLKLRYEVTNLSTNTSRSNWCVIGMLRKYPN